MKRDFLVYSTDVSTCYITKITHLKIPASEINKPHVHLLHLLYWQWGNSKTKATVTAQLNISEVTNSEYDSSLDQV